MNKVAQTRKTLVITKHGKPVAELRPYSARRPATLIGLHRGQLTINGRYRVAAQCAVEGT
jgi:antitoxin (DNA-binding transcriptional repressor) of toxin-antitoxin stability system